MLLQSFKCFQYFLLFHSENYIFPLIKIFLTTKKQIYRNIFK